MNFCELVGKLNGIQNIPHSIIGRSVMGQPIYAFYAGGPNAKNTVLVTGGMHAREWVTALAVTELAKKYYNSPPRSTRFIFVPLTNPDGVRLAMDGLTPFFQKPRKFLLSVNSGSSNFSEWKANINAVDINQNFDANWGGGRQNVFAPAPANYVGSFPESEPETMTLVRLVNRIRPLASIAFHTKGETVYYGFRGLPPELLEKTRILADDAAQITGYTPVQSLNSAGGLSDWAALSAGAPSLTIEVGADTLPHPITETLLPQIMQRVNNVLDIFL